jgi:large subunit ribosomal protein L14
MLFQNSFLEVADNTGPKIVKCLKRLNNHGSTISLIGEEIRIAVQGKRYVRYRKKKLDKKIFKALIISVKNKHRRLNGNFITFSANRAVLLNDDLQFLGTRVKGPICKELRYTKIKALRYKRIISYAGLSI